jgi:hypothetical protein
MPRRSNAPGDASPARAEQPRIAASRAADNMAVVCAHDLLREMPSGYRDTDLFYVPRTRLGRGWGLWPNLVLQFRDDRLINFDRDTFRHQATLFAEGKEHPPRGVVVSIGVEGS